MSASYPKYDEDDDGFDKTVGYTDHFEKSFWGPPEIKGAS
jgi:hypothetical protein